MSRPQAAHWAVKLHMIPNYRPTIATINAPSHQSGRAALKCLGEALLTLCRKVHTVSMIAAVDF